MIVGIVGSEAAKFTPKSEAAAKNLIRGLLTEPIALTGDSVFWSSVSEVVSGGCHLGGIDQWAAEIGRELGLEVTEFLPKSKNWETGYKPRNLQIAQRSDVVYCITVDRLPDDYSGMRFSLCYHCGTKDHVKSGGCWTMKQGIKLGKIGHLLVVNQ